MASLSPIDFVTDAKGEVRSACANTLLNHDSPIGAIDVAKVSKVLMDEKGTMM